jgi:hypothetical protein
MPGDDLLPAAAPATTRAITIDAAVDDVFPWLLQIGYGRGGWYSYDWIDNDGRPSVERIDPALQTLAVGDQILMLPGMGPTVKELVPNHYVLSGGERDTWCMLVKPTDDGRTRLVSRWRQDWEKSASSGTSPSAGQATARRSDPAARSSPTRWAHHDLAEDVLGKRQLGLADPNHRHRATLEDRDGGAGREPERRQP